MNNDKDSSAGVNVLGTVFTERMLVLLFNSDGSRGLTFLLALCKPMFLCAGPGIHRLV